MEITSINGVKSYNLSAGKTLPDWLTKQQKKALRKDEDFQRRIELLQDFDFPAASQRVKMSPDGRFICATGVYPPRMKMFELAELSLKFERHFTNEIVQFQFLSEDFRKTVYMYTDRTIDIHAAAGSYHTLRIPKMGRDMVYHHGSADLLCVGSSSEVYRLNLEQGRFLSSLQTEADGINVAKINPSHQLYAFGTENGTVECWDPRSKARTGLLRVDDTIFRSPLCSQYGISNVGREVTAIEFDTDGLTMAVGTDAGIVALYDLRNPYPTLLKDHQYELSIKSISFHGATSRNVLSADSKSLKVWNRDTGKTFCSVEPDHEISDLCVPDAQSGLVVFGSECPRVQSFFIPALGPAPKWCSFLDNLTEEMETSSSVNSDVSGGIYEDYKFVTREELSDLGLTALIGSSALRAFMHGFFMDIKMYQKARALANPEEFDAWRKERIKKKLEEKRKDRVGLVKVPTPASAASSSEKSEKQEEHEILAKQVGASDSRFSAILSNPDFQRPEKRSRAGAEDDDDEEPQEEEVVMGGAEDDSDDGLDYNALKFRKSKKEKDEKKNLKMFELKDGNDMALDLQKEKKKVNKNISLAERLKQQESEGNPASKKPRSNNKDEADESAGKQKSRTKSGSEETVAGQRRGVRALHLKPMPTGDWRGAHKGSSKKR